MSKTIKKKEKTNTTRKKHKILPHHYTEKQKQNIVDQITPISLEDAEKSFEKLQKLKCKGAITASSQIRIGNDVVDKFTLIERLSTKGHVGIDFYTFWTNRKYFSQLNYVKNMLKYYKTRKISDIRKYRYIFNVYFSSISIFRPVVAMEIYCKYPSRVAILDMTMGWGGRLVGACALNVPKYIGIDSNKNLIEPYRKMEDFLRDKTTTEMDIRFQDALTVDYSSLKYDLVLTSPPYYDLEIYGNSTKTKTKEEWDIQFYQPLFERTWKALMTGGTYCINVPVEIYERNCVPVLGESLEKHILKKQSRNKSAANDYTEYIYVWKK
jgi:hypothetical protein